MLNGEVLPKVKYLYLQQCNTRSDSVPDGSTTRSHAMFSWDSLPTGIRRTRVKNGLFSWGLFKENFVKISHFSNISSSIRLPNRVRQSVRVMKFSLQPIVYSIILSLRPSSFHFLLSVSGFHPARSKIAKKDQQLRHVFLSISPFALTTWLPLDGFSWNLTFIFSKICRENSSSIKIWQK